MYEGPEYRFVRVRKGSTRKSKLGQTKLVRVGSRNPGRADKHPGSRRRPY